MKLKRIISIVLVIALLGVWGTIIYRVVHSASSDDNAADQATANDGKTANAITRYRYVDDVKDPFAIGPAPRKQGHDSSGVRKKKEIIVVLPPPYKLNGIIFNPGRKVAILEASDGGTYFLSEKDTLDGMMIAKIETKKVLYVYHAQKMIWQIE